MTEFKFGPCPAMLVSEFDDDSGITVGGIGHAKIDDYISSYDGIDVGKFQTNSIVMFIKEVEQTPWEQYSRCIVLLPMGQLGWVYENELKFM